ncbi:MAG: hypothetical protein V4501_12275 [Pseudomonadota bacterium]
MRNQKQIDQSRIARACITAAAIITLLALLLSMSGCGVFKKISNGNKCYYSYYPTDTACAPVVYANPMDAYKAYSRKLMSAHGYRRAYFMSYREVMKVLNTGNYFISRKAGVIIKEDCI